LFRNGHEGIVIYITSVDNWLTPFQKEFQVQDFKILLAS